MVASIGAVASPSQGAGYYERDGYYAKDDPAHREASAWAGRGAAALGLEGPVDPDTFKAVLDGTVPDGSGRRLGRTGKGGAFEHRPGRDITFSAPKSVSLTALTTEAQRHAAEAFERTGQKVRRFTDLTYGARSWDRPRRVIAKLEHTRGGANPRYVVTSLEDDAQALYDGLYCARGDMENRIKEQQLDLFADRTSCHHWWANQFRLVLASLAYTLIETIRRVGLNGTELARAYVGTIRLKLFKIAAVILINTRRVKFLLASTCPYQRLYFLVARRLAGA